MSDLPLISIALVTYKRAREAAITIRSTCDRLKYPKELRSWYIADDGSDPNEFNSLRMILEMEKRERLIGFHNERMRNTGQENTYFSGKGWNRALGLCHQNSDFVLFLEDDWELDEELDLVPYVRLLQGRENVGMVSFRILSVGNHVETVGYKDRLYLKYLRSTQYSYSGNPNLRHARFTTHYGWFHEERTPGEIELDLDSRYREMDEGPSIWRPLDISVWGAWKHIGTEKTWE